MAHEELAGTIDAAFEHGFVKLFGERAFTPDQSGAARLTHIARRANDFEHDAFFWKRQSGSKTRGNLMSLPQSEGTPTGPDFKWI